MSRFIVMFCVGFVCCVYADPDVELCLGISRTELRDRSFFQLISTFKNKGDKPVYVLKGQVDNSCVAFYSLETGEKVERQMASSFASLSPYAQYPLEYIVILNPNEAYSVSVDGRVEYNATQDRYYLSFYNYDVPLVEGGLGVKIQYRVMDRIVADINDRLGVQVLSSVRSSLLEFDLDGYIVRAQTGSHRGTIREHR